MKKIILTVTNDLVTDNRVHKIASTLSAEGADVTLIGRKLAKSPGLSKRPYHTARFKLLFNRGMLFYAEYNFRLFFYLLFSRAHILVANDLDTLLANFLVAGITGKQLFYDSHEYFTEVPELVNRKVKRNIWLLLEKMILPRIKYAYTVSEPIAETYRKRYGVEMAVIRNTPAYLDIKQNDTGRSKTRIILYQGSLNLGRGLEHVIDAMQHLGDQYHLRIIGSGDIEAKLQERVRDLNVGHKVSFLGRIPFQKLKYETIKADLGIALEENIGLNYYYALPNKLFDYIQAHVPVIVSPFPEMQKIVNEYQIGTVYDHKDPQSLARKIEEIFSLGKRYQKWKENTNKASKELCWEKESQKLLRLYKPFLT